MVIPTDVQVTFIVAAVLADLGAKQIYAAKAVSEERLTSLYGRYKFRAVSYPGLFLGPGATAFMLGWPAWESQYWSPVFELTANQPAYAMYYALFLFLLFAGAWFGTWLGFKWVIEGKRKTLRILYTSVLLLTLGIYFWQWPAPVRLGSYKAFHTNPDDLPYIWQNRGFFISFCLILVYTTIPLIIWAFNTWKESRK